MLNRWLARRAVAKIALGGLALGLVALAGLTIWATVQTRTATTRVKAFNEVSAEWNTIFVRLGAEDAALREFLATNGSEYGREDLAATVRSAEPELAWLEKHGGSVEAAHVQMLRLAYEKYTAVVEAVLESAADQGELSIYQELATLDFDQLRDQVIANVERKQREVTLYLNQVDQQNTSLRFIAIGIVMIDLSLCAMSMAVLAVYQQRAERAAAKSRHQALHDPLTALANRHLLAEHMNRAIAEARRRQGATSLLLIDLDRFKQVNDTFGHHCGDALLQRVASRMAATSREGDVVARIGGDEFAILLSAVDSPADVPAIAERVLKAIKKPVELDGCRVDVGASIGASIFPIDCGNGEELLRNADSAMYTAKRGNLGVNVYNPDGNDKNPKVLALLYELHRGIEGGGLVVHYQPRIDIRTMRIGGAEALVRWQHPTRGLLLPDTFLSLIERSEYIERLTDTVFQSAARQAHEWLVAGRPMSVGVNIPVRSLLDPDFPAMVAGTIEQFGLPPHLLTFELNEAALTTKPTAAIEALHQLRPQGVRISIDGFRVGVSSMALLRDMPVHEVKLDRNLIARMRADERDRAVVKATLDLANNLSLDTVAMGVEDRETLAMLAEFGCHVIQGYHVSKPLPPDELSVWLDRQFVAPPIALINY